MEMDSGQWLRGGNTRGSKRTSKRVLTLVEILSMCNCRLPRVNVCVAMMTRAKSQQGLFFLCAERLVHLFPCSNASAMASDPDNGGGLLSRRLISRSVAMMTRAKSQQGRFFFCAERLVHQSRATITRRELCCPSACRMPPSNIKTLS